MAVGLHPLGRYYDATIPDASMADARQLVRTLDDRLCVGGGAHGLWCAGHPDGEPAGEAIGLTRLA
jgi:hypothetical protein